MDLARNLLAHNVQVLNSQVSRSAYQGLGIALVTVIAATLLVAYYQAGSISIESVANAQANSGVLWLIDSVPFFFALWGQYASAAIVVQASAMVYDQTQEIRLWAESVEKQATYSATHDEATDLPNRALFYDRVEQAIRTGVASNRPFVLLQLEVANFKDIHLTLGRIGSDLVLKQMATRLTSVLNVSDSVARLDSNVFGLMLFTHQSDDDGIRLAKNIHVALDPTFMVNHIEVVVHSNIGMVSFPRDGDDVDSLIQKAGAAMVMAANSHEGYRFYDASSDSILSSRLTLMSQLRQAIENNQLHLYYQAKISIQTGTLYGAEALMRWQHPQLGFVSPDDFIPMAERTRFVKRLSTWVLNQAFRDCASWHKQGLDLVISVNLSARDLQDPELPDVITGIAASTGINPRWVMLEITESAIMTDPERALAIINRLHGMGYRFSIDDFGTGYSSLAYLKKMPLTELKIDKSFVSDLLDSENDAVIVHATINLAHNLGLHVTAEGVENQAILDQLMIYGCDIAQGYHLSKPLHFADFNHWMQQSKWKVKSL